MANVATNKSARLYFSDGGGTPNTLLVSPMEGDVEYTPGEVSILEVLDRGSPIANGEGVLEESVGLAEMTFTIYVKELNNSASSPDCVLRWMRNTSDSSASALSGVWSSTTTRTDGRATVDLVYYPLGTGAGKPSYKLDDCMLVSKTMAEGSPSLFSVTLRSTTQSEWQLTAAT